MKKKSSIKAIIITVVICISFFTLLGYALYKAFQPATIVNTTTERLFITDMEFETRTKGLLELEEFALIDTNKQSILVDTNDITFKKTDHTQSYIDWTILEKNKHFLGTYFEEEAVIYFTDEDISKYSKLHIKQFGENMVFDKEE